MLPTLTIAILVCRTATACVWVRVCRDTGTHDQPPFGKPKFSSAKSRRTER